MVKVKICGITSLKDAWEALDAGADALGFVFYPPSSRKVSPGEARAIIRTLPPLVTPVGVFVDEDIRVIARLSESCGLKLVQLHGSETPRMVSDLGLASMKVIRVRGAADVKEARRFGSRLIMFDSWDSTAPGGTGKKFAWSALKIRPAESPVRPAAEDSTRRTWPRRCAWCGRSAWTFRRESRRVRASRTSGR